ncbi:hypothetical protein PVK06_034876 [Gossypium arboreum]|uniref:Uncharacterized protein n=1 Tax=Gossypium arboreum TaxID=29729 RepID=A0ABR0NFC4_GOSAR|nr:hypothetical protein PVK06_034876 [Gossypium arboreum]
MAKVSWKQICSPKEKGRVGVVNLAIKNKALLAKRRWRLVLDKKALWSKVILAKYGTNAKQWRFSANKLKEISTVWRGIVENSLDARVARWMGDKDFSWKIGNGKIHGSCKSMWLIAIWASCWSIGLARNEMMFKNKVLSMDTLIFHSKMKALLWVRAAFDEGMIQGRLLWFCLYKCSFPNPVSRG